MAIEYLHTMVRAKDLDKTMEFFKLLGLKERQRKDVEAGRFTLVFMCPPEQDNGMADVEITYNWDGDDALPDDSRHFGHLAYRVDDIYEMCAKLQDAGVTINRPPRDGHMAFVRSPDNISVELLQKGDAKEPQEPWASMENTGHW
ncbi:VOC family protein [Maribius pontilimi]|uniref:VOC family protein n=1 Tax=Palleronia pontilimi TaxID=1964209 RepID=A0A934IH40_9RHOB|nr:VOC family protein [Palleronia pontilimi]MBJ3762731.1 VOC family protein [Palleronia pontilimi]